MIPWCCSLYATFSGFKAHQVVSLIIYYYMMPFLMQRGIRNHSICCTVWSTNQIPEMNPPPFRLYTDSRCAHWLTFYNENSWPTASQVCIAARTGQLNTPWQWGPGQATHTPGLNESIQTAGQSQANHASSIKMDIHDWQSTQSTLWQQVPPYGE